MKLIVQIPCFNEAETLARTVAEVPRDVAGFDCVEVLVIDDGSTDETRIVARRAGSDHVVAHAGNRGLACAFATGIDAALRLGADVIVNIDGDGQYAGGDIPRLVAPIVRGEADVVVGDRRPGNLAHFSLGKRVLQRAGSFVVRSIAGVTVPDAVSGLRAFSREAALGMNVVSRFSYTIETLVQAGERRLAVASLPVAARHTPRPSRLAKGAGRFVARSAATLLRAYAMYYPLKVFAALGVLLVAAGAVPIARFLWLALSGDSGGHLQSLVLGSTLVVMGFLSLLAGLLADLIAVNRRLLEATLLRVRRLECEAARGREQHEWDEIDSNAEFEAKAGERGAFVPR